jgi:hypothetical protein
MQLSSTLYALNFILLNIFLKVDYGRPIFRGTYPKAKYRLSLFHPESFNAVPRHRSWPGPLSGCCGWAKRSRHKSWPVSCCESFGPPKLVLFCPICFQNADMFFSRSMSLPLSPLAINSSLRDDMDLVL